MLDYVISTFSSSPPMIEMDLEKEVNVVIDTSFMVVSQVSLTLKVVLIWQMICRSSLFRVLLCVWSHSVSMSFPRLTLWMMQTVTKEWLIRRDNLKYIIIAGLEKDWDEVWISETSLLTKELMKYQRSWWSIWKNGEDDESFLSRNNEHWYICNIIIITGCQDLSLSSI